MRLFARLGSWFLSNLAWQLLVSAIPFSVGIVALARAWIDQPTPIWLVLAVAAGWSLTLILLIFWFQDNTIKRRDRSVTLAQAMMHLDESLVVILDDVQHPPLENRDLLCAQIEYLLHRMVRVLAYRIPELDKGATFLHLNGNGFEVFAQVNHDDPAVSRAVATKLTKDNCLAGQAIMEDKVMVIHDCCKSDSASKWVHTSDPPRFRGRAAASVPARGSKVSSDIGALCFDVKVPWTLSEEDQKLMQLFAYKIGALWALLH